ncbi:MAG: GtrA family protein [Candidatus Taylorbacteria bacterium]|nr:GtrA family protein [Candidatus Taylorbacteria bacterium]
MNDTNKLDSLAEVVRMVWPRLLPLYGRYRTLANYLISGSTGAFVNLFSLFILTHIFRLWYLLSSVLAFLLAFGFSFFLQKHWTFRDHSNDGVHKQMSLFMAVSLINLGVNTALMYFFVDIIGKTYFPNYYDQTLWYLLSQFVAAGLIAIESFFVYRAFIFRRA